MGKSFNILIWDGYGCGLNLIMPRLFEVYGEKNCITFNSFSYENDADIESFIIKHNIENLFGSCYTVIK